MHIISLFSVLALNGVALATIDFNNWAPPGPGDVRGPCPAMNSLANHHIIPHDGRNVTVPHLVEVLGDIFNLSPELATVVSQLGLATAPDPTTGSFNLPDLDKHNAFEHDASLTRVDFALSGIPGDAKLDHALFAQFMSHFDGMDYITIPAAAAARYSRVQSSRAHTPGFTYTAIQQITSYAETIKYFRTMVDPTNGLTSKKFVRILFEEERLPFLEGWRPPANVTNGFFIAEDVMLLALATPEKSVYFNEAPPKNADTTHDIPTCGKEKLSARHRPRTILG